MCIKSFTFAIHVSITELYIIETVNNPIYYMMSDTQYQYNAHACAAAVYHFAFVYHCACMYILVHAQTAQCQYCNEVLVDLHVDSDTTYIYIYIPVNIHF